MNIPDDNFSDSPSGRDLDMLVRWINWFTYSLAALGLFFVVLYGFLRSPASLIIGTIMLLIFLPLILHGRRAAKQGRAGPALAAIGFCCWMLALVVAARGHTALPAALPLLLLPIIFALPFVDRKVLLWISVAALGLCAVAGALTIGPPLLASRIDETTLAIIMVPIILISAGLAIFGLCHVGSALRSSLRETNSMNARLADSERVLESKVRARTHELRDVVDELSDIDKISRTVNVTLELDEVLEAMQAALQRVFHFDNLSVLLLDNDRKRLMVDHVNGIDLNSEQHRQILEQGVSATDENSVFTAVLQRRQALLTAEITNEQIGMMSETDKLLYEVNPVKSLLVCPLEFEGESIGVMLLGRIQQSMDLSPEEIARIQRYISPLAIVIRNAHLLEEAEIARAEAQASNLAKSQFLANMSHELRTPLNAIIGFSEILAEDAEEAGHSQYLDDLGKIYASGHDLLQLIQSVLDLTRIEVGTLKVEASEFDVAELLENVVAKSTPAAQKEGNELVFSVGMSAGQMFSDQNKVQQILQNLLSNACKFTHDGNIRTEVERFTEDGSDWLRFKVIDDGIGMTAEQVESIFQPFTQADESSSRRYGGTGLGLATSQQMCEILGGSIEVESTQAQGSTFTVVLPATISG